MASRSVPAAIVVAGALVGLGLYLGLRARPEPRAAPPPAPVMAPAPPPTAGLDVKATVQARAEAAVEAIRDTLVKECWQPSAAKDPEPPSIAVGLSLSFDAAGKMRGTGVLERRDANRPDISQCLTDRVHALSIEGAGVPVSVEVELRLP